MWLSWLLSGIPLLWDYSYEYDRWGNLRMQASTAMDRSEDFGYDQLHRLTSSNRYMAGTPMPSGAVSYAYNKKHGQP